MAFTFTNYAGIQPQQSPLHDMIGQILSGYNDTTKAQFLRPGLEEQLKKAQQENQWYGPNMQSQIGLRGAQAGHANSLTTGQNQQNKVMPQMLQYQLEAAQSAALENQYYNDLLKRRLSRQQGQPGQIGQPGNIQQQIQQRIQQPEYTPGLGQAPIMQPSQAQQIQQAMQSQQPTAALQFNQAPQLTDDDIDNKKLFGIDTFGPRYKAYVNSIAKSMDKKQAEDFKLQAKKDYDDFKEISAAQTDVPVLENTLESAIRMRDIIQNRPAFFGHYLAPGLFSKRATDELVGEFQSKLVPQLAATESKLSQRGNQLALKISESKLPGFADSQQVALGKIDGLINEIQKRLGVSRDIVGGKIKKIGGKRLKFIDGEWYELEKGEY